MPQANEVDAFRSLRLFTRVFELGSFSAAAREGGLSQPTISKVVAALERSLGARLLERSTTSLTPTEEGRRFYERARAMLDAYADALADVRGQAQSISGPLTVHAPVGLGELHLNRLIMVFLARHQGIEVELILHDRAVDLVEEGVDVAIRLGSKLPPNAVARRVGVSPRVLVAAPAYLAAAPMPQRPEDLADHEYIRYAGHASSSNLEFSNEAERVFVSTRGRFRVNNSLAIREALLAGVGLASAPSWLVQDLIDSGALAPLLSEWRMPTQPLHLLYPSRRYQPFRARALLQFLDAELPKLRGVNGC